MEKQQILQQVDRLAVSRSLQGSEALCSLLRYLANHAIEHPGLSIKEYQIATEALGRPSEFDPQFDSTVRVQASRLRSKLLEHYNTDGIHDPIRVELPKGQYLISFHHHHHRDAKDLAQAAAPLSQSPRPQSRYRKWGIVSVSVVLAVIAVEAILLLFANRPLVHADDAHQGSTLSAVRFFWNSFSGNQEAPWVVFGDATGPAAGGLSVPADRYVGEGEVLAVHELDRVFGVMQRQIVVKSGRHVSLDDAKERNLILIGEAVGNSLGTDIPFTKQFVFMKAGAFDKSGHSGIVNVHPRGDEPSVFGGTPTETYAVVALTKGFAPGKTILLLQGTTAVGTQAAAELFCHEGSIERFLARVAPARSAKLRPFEAVIRVKVVNGVPLGSEVVAYRTDASSWF